MMTAPRVTCFETGYRLVLAGLCLALASGCSALRATKEPGAPVFYALDRPPGAAPTAGRSFPDSAPTLAVSTPGAAAGYASKRIIYVRQAHRLEYFAHSEWIDTPARMLSPLLVAAAERSGAFRAVVHAPSSASGELRLDSEVLKLQHEFDSPPSRVRFVLRVHLIEDATRRVIATRDLEAVATAPSEDPYGGVIAANQSVKQVLEQLAAFCASAAGNWRPENRVDGGGR